MNVLIQFRRGTASEWASANPTLAQGEIGLETDTNRIKIGNGATLWNVLPYYALGANLSELNDVVITSAADGDFLRWTGSEWINDAVNLGVDSVGDYIETIIEGTGVTVFGATGESASATISIGQDVATNASVTFATVTASDFFGSLTGNADTATSLRDQRVISVTGDVSGTGIFDGSQNVEINTTINANSVELGTDTTGNYVGTISSGTGVTIFGGEPGEGSNASVAIGQDVSTSASVTFAAVTAEIDGNAATASQLQSARNIALTGDVAGSVSFDGTQNVEIATTVQPASVNLEVDTTGDYVETIEAGTGVTVFSGTGHGSNPSVAIGQDVATNASVTFAALEVSGQTILNGDLFVSGTTTEINTTELSVSDNIITLNSGQQGTPTLDAGIAVERGDEPEVDLRWNETVNRWEFTDDGENYYPIPIEIQNLSNVNLSDSPANIAVNSFLYWDGEQWTDYVPDLKLNDLNDVDVEGLSTGQLLQWDGTKWVNITLTLGTHTEGDYIANIQAGTGVTIFNGSGEGASTSIEIGQDVATNASVTFAAVTSDLIGNADSASVLQTSRTIELVGDVAGSVSFDGSQNAQISTTIQPDSVALGSDTSGDYVEGISGGTGVTVYGSGGEGASVSVEIGQDVATNASVTFAVIQTTEDVEVGGNLVVQGDLTINGDTTQLNTTELNVEDNIITLNSGVSGSPTLNAGIEINRGTSDDVSVRWNETDDVWEFTNDGAEYIPFVTEFDDITNVSVASPSNGELLQFDGTNWVNAVQAGGEPIGLEERTDSVISFNDANRTFTISPADSSYDVWCKGKRFVKTGSESVQIGATSGLYFIYFNSSGVLSVRTTYFDWESDTPVASVYWNATLSGAQFVADERHGVVLDWQTHEYLHRTQGAVIASGFGIGSFVLDGDGSSNDHVTFSIADGTFFDEDLQVDVVSSATPTADTWEQILAGPAEIPVFYLLGTEWVKDAATIAPLKIGVSRPVYNKNTDGVWSVEDVANNSYTIVWIIATNNINEPVIATMGQQESLTKSGSEAVVWGDLTLPDFPIFEYRPLHKLVYQVGEGYTNDYKAVLAGVYDLRRVIPTSSVIPSESVSDHGNLTGLSDDDHPQYLTNERHDILDHSAAMSSVVFNDISDVSINSVASGDFVKWNGSAWVNDPINLGNDTVGGYVAQIEAGTGVTVFNGSGESASTSISIGQDVSTSASVSFANVTSNLLGNVTGNADTATTLATSRTISLSGDVTGSVSFNGSQNVDIVATVSNDAVALGANTTGNYVETVLGGTGVTVFGVDTESASASVAIGQDVATTADVTFNSVTISSAPSSNSDAVTKAYVDNIAAGIDWHPAVKLATSTTLPDSPAYDNGASGVGATLTATSYARLSVDGANATTGDRVLVKNQTDQKHNGVYVVTAQGSGVGEIYWVLTRASDFDGTPFEEITTGEAVFVTSGAVNARQGFVLTTSGTGTNDSHIVGTDNLSFTQFTGTQAFTAGSGIIQDGNTINVGTANVDRIVVNADDIDLATVFQSNTSGSASTTFITGVTVDDYGRVTGQQTSAVNFNDTTLTGVPTAPTAALNTETTQVATTEFVVEQIATQAIEKQEINAKGDLITGSANDNPAVLSLGTDGFFLKANSEAALGIEWASIPTINALNDIGDVTITDVANGEFLKWDSSTSQWVNDSIPEINFLSDVGDVVLDETVPSGHGIIYSGSQWTNSSLVYEMSDLSDTDIDPVGSRSDGQVIRWSDNLQAFVNDTLTLSQTLGMYLGGVEPGTGVTIFGGETRGTNASIAIGQDVATNASVTFAGVTLGNEPAENDDATTKLYVDTGLNLKSNIDSPTFTGVPEAPTASAATNTTQIATTAFVRGEITALVGSAPETLDTLAELAAALADDDDFATTVTNGLALKAPLADPTFTGTVVLPVDTDLREQYFDFTASATLSIATHRFKVIEANSSSALTITIPTNANEAFPIGTTFSLIRVGTGEVTIAGDSGVTVNTALGLRLRAQWSAATLRKRGTDTWLLTGDTKV